MKEKDMQVMKLYPEEREKSLRDNRMVRYVTQADYDIGGTHVFCWLCEPYGENAAAEDYIVTVCLYSSPCGLLSLEFDDCHTAEGVFDLIVRYEISPYHMEDILEDREIHTTIRYL